VHDVNHALRRLRIDPAPPGHGVRDAVKRRAFDGLSVVTGKGRAFRGVGAIAGLPAVAELPQPLL
jgi:hypothetical protein